MTTIASCGCTLESSRDLVSVRYSGEDCVAGEGFVPTVFYASYCPKCAENAKAWPAYLADDEAEEAFWAKHSL